MREVTNERQKDILEETLVPVHESVYKGVQLTLVHDTDADVYFVRAYGPSKGVDKLFQLEGDERRDWERVVGWGLGEV